MNDSKRYLDNYSQEKADSVSDRPLPQLFIRKEDCCGCSACCAICPTNQSLQNEEGERNHSFSGAIHMAEDEEGFLYPIIDSDLCIRCYRCISVCPIRIADNNRT